MTLGPNADQGRHSQTERPSLLMAIKSAHKKQISISAELVALGPHGTGPDVGSRRQQQQQPLPTRAVAELPKRCPRPRNSRPHKGDSQGAATPHSRRGTESRKASRICNTHSPTDASYGALNNYYHNVIGRGTHQFCILNQSDLTKRRE